ncbi:MAG: ABC transporter ATP-binding protein [Lachnospiraceae bacterium]
MEKILEIKNATKTVKDKILLDEVNLEVSQGEIIGIVGRNGSGKTVLFKCICGFMKLTSGEIWVNAKEIGKGGRLAEGTGIIIENPGFLPAYSGYRNLLFLAGVRNKIDKNKVKEVMETVGLDPDSRKPVRTYSMGMKQRLAIAQAIMEDQELLILDEPMNGLDNSGVEDVRRLLLTLREKGKTILIASHIREDINILCDCVYNMEAGVLRPVEAFSPD